MKSIVLIKLDAYKKVIDLQIPSVTHYFIDFKDASDY